MLQFIATAMAIYLMNSTFASISFMKLSARFSKQRSSLPAVSAVYTITAIPSGIKGMAFIDFAKLSRCCSVFIKVADCLRKYRLLIAEIECFAISAGLSVLSYAIFRQMKNSIIANCFDHVPTNGSLQII